MNKYLSLIVVPLFILVSHAATAGAMKCGTHLIEDGQSPGQSRTDIEEQCGPPERSAGNILHYMIGDVMYRLQFNDAGELESIDELQQYLQSID